MPTSFAGLVGSLFGSKKCTFSYYYYLLDAQQKRLYQSILSGFKYFAKEIRLPLRPINEIMRVYEYVQRDHPELFYASSTYRYTTDLYRKSILLQLDYLFDKRSVSQINCEIQKHLQGYDVIKDKIDLEKELFVHDKCLKHLRYDYAFDDVSHTVLGPIQNKKGVCEGIAKYIKLVFDYLDVSSLLVTGKAVHQAGNGILTQNHMWNMIQIEDSWYHLDVTFDITMMQSYNRYDYFNIADDDIKKNHTISSDVPACVTYGRDYFSLYSLRAASASELGNMLACGLRQGKRVFLVKLMNVNNKDDIINKVMVVAQAQSNLLTGACITVGLRYNLDQMIFEIEYK